MIDPAILDKKHIKYHVIKYLKELGNLLIGKIVIDLPAGSGSTSEFLLGAGATVEAYDLFPEYFKVSSIKCQRVDITAGTSIKPNHADYVICQEGMEHFSDQLKAMKEFNKILKANGKLVITVPSYSHLSAKLSYLLFESENGKNMPQNELTDVWMLDKNVSTEIYHGHIFMLGLQKLRTLAKLSGFNVEQIRFVNLSRTSLLLFPFFYPFILFHSISRYHRNINRNKELDGHAKRLVFKQQLLMNINPKNLLNKHTFVVFSKYCEISQVHDELAFLAKNSYVFDQVM
jgi:SAM-dependent methyltransferase